MRRPRWSIIIPTADRSHLLPAALASALSQTAADLEVVVSDNGTGSAAQAVAAAAGDGRVRYVRTRGGLLMHESWRCALEQARGELVTILCDDDALHPRALDAADRALTAHEADAAAWRSCSWAMQAGGPGTDLLFGPPYSDRVLAVDAARFLDAAFDLRIGYTDLAPKMLNSAVRRELLERLAAGGASLFGPASPDYFAMLVIAAYARRIILLDAPLLVAGAAPESIGASSLVRGEAARRFIDALLSREPRLLLPHPPLTRSVWLAQTYLQAARDTPALRGRAVNLVHAYGMAGVDIAALQARGVDTRDFEDQLEATLRGPLCDEATAVRAFIAAPTDLATESYLRPIEGAAAALGHGAIILDEARVLDGSAAAMGAFAAGLDGWLASRARRLEGLWISAIRRAGGRTVVIYGLGRNGRALLRRPPPQKLVQDGRFAVYDDALREPETHLPRIARFDALDSRRHFALVTPAACEPIARRLESAGFARGRDWAALADLACPAEAGAAPYSCPTVAGRV